MERSIGDLYINEVCLPFAHYELIEVMCQDSRFLGLALEDTAETELDTEF